MRLDTLNITIDETDIPTLRTIKNRIPLLRSLSMIVEPLEFPTIWNSADIPEDCHDIFKSAPLLTRIKLLHLSTWQFNWKTITVLKLVGEPCNEGVLEILPQMKNLEELLVNQTNFHKDVYDENTFIVVPRLRVLTIFPLMLISALTAPSLEELYLDSIGQSLILGSKPASVTSFLQRSSCKLKCLGLGRCSVQYLEVVLQHTPDIKSLSVLLSDRENEAYFYDILACSERRPLLAPNMQSFRLLYPTMSTQCISKLKGVLASRTAEQRGPAARLREFTIFKWTTDSYRTETDNLRMRCRDLGIQFNIVLEGGDPYLYRLSGQVEDDDF